LCKLELLLNLTGNTKLEYERKNEENSGRSSKMTPSCKWPIDSPPFDDPAELCVHESHIPKDRFEPIFDEAKPKHSF